MSARCTYANVCYGVELITSLHDRIYVCWVWSSLQVPYVCWVRVLFTSLYWVWNAIKAFPSYACNSWWDKSSARYSIKITDHAVFHRCQLMMSPMTIMTNTHSSPIFECWLHKFFYVYCGSYVKVDLDTVWNSFLMLRMMLHMIKHILQNVGFYHMQHTRLILYISCLTVLSMFKVPQKVI